MDWDTPLFSASQLTPDLLVGWSPGCTDQSHLGVCRDVDGSPNYANSVSRSVVWVTPLNNTTIYVDTNGSGISCPSGAGAEQTISATALVSYKINNDGVVGRNNVRDEFATAAYNINGPNNTQNWDTNWTETGDDNSATAGSMRINGGFLELRNSAGTEAGDTIWRGKNLSGNIFARFSFQIQGTTIDAGEDRIAVEVSPDGGSTWYLLETFDGPISTLQTMVYNISPYISASTRIRFHFMDNLEAGDLWQIDNVNIEYSTSGDFDMTGAYIRTCDGTKLAAAYGQDPSKSENNDYEALDLGTVIVPYRALIDTSLDKQASNSSPKIGETITFSLVVSNASGMGAATNLQIVDVVPPGYAYVPGSISGGSTRDDASPYTAGLSWTIAALPPGSSTVLSYQVVVLGGVDSYANYAEIKDANQPDIDSDPGNNSTTEDDDDIETVVPRSAVIGNSVWLDENGDGIRDAGETGIANVTVQLWNADHTVLLATTVTDTNGNYIFKDLAPGTYQVDVLNSSLPAGLVQTTVIGGSADDTNKADPYTLTVALNSENLQADFGFNWVPSGDTFGNTGTGAIGDRLWIDADGDGRQDPGEPGLASVPVDLLAAGPDGLFGTPDDVIVASTVSGYDGSYIFDNLPAGAYLVRVNNGTTPSGYTLTADPDQPGVPCLTCDNRTTTPILLAPGDVFVNADFGYQPLAGYGAAIGDTLWLDADQDNTLDTDEPRLAGVSVVLIRDLNGNGAWEAGEPIIATTVTDAQGSYQFNGVPVSDGIGTDDYLVWVNDTNNVLFGLVPTYDSDGVASANLSAVSNLSPTGDFTQDFAYAPAGQTSGEGLIGDTIFYDQDADGAFDPGEGLEGVRVNLFWDTNGDGNFDVGEPLIASTLTNENGQYFFGNLAAGNYVVQVDTNTLPAGVSNTVDQGDSTPNEGGVTLTSGQVVLSMDFGYRDLSNPNSISGTIWVDTNGDGTLAGESGRFAGVTVVLRDSNGNLVATTTTDANGEYAFNNLPDGTYTVDVTDQAGVLIGTWHSDGPNDNSDLNSQVDPYTVTVANGQSNATADFGYYQQPAAAGNLVWLDRDGDGVQDPDEPGIKDVVVTLTITYPNSTVVTLNTLTDANGFYSFGNLLLDENFNANGGGLIYTISVATPPSMSASPEALPGDYDQTDGDSDGAGENLTILQGETDPSYDFGFSGNFDMGDLPENLLNLPDYPTYFVNGPSNVVFPDNGGQPGPDTTAGVIAIWLGMTVDTEPQGQPSAFAIGDGSDEDGLSTNPGSWVINSYANFDLILNSSEPTTVYYGMWLDWDQDGVFDDFYNGSGMTNSPVVVSVPVLIQPEIQTNPVFVRVRVYDRPLAFSDYQGTRVNGETEDYRFEKPTAVTLGDFNAEAGIGQITLTWTTYTELNTIGFNLYRATSPDGPFEKINAALIPSQSLLGPGSPYFYEYTDETAAAGVTYYYWLEEVTLGGSVRLRMISASSWFAVYLPFMMR